MHSTGLLAGSKREAEPPGAAAVAKHVGRCSAAKILGIGNYGGLEACNGNNRNGFLPNRAFANLRVDADVAVFRKIHSAIAQTYCSSSSSNASCTAPTILRRLARASVTMMRACRYNIGPYSPIPEWVLQRRSRICSSSCDASGRNCSARRKRSRTANPSIVAIAAIPKVPVPQAVPTAPASHSPAPVVSP